MECLDSSLFTLRPGCQIDAKQQLAPRPQLDNRKISNSFHNISKSKFITRQSSEESHHSGPFRETSSLAPTMADVMIK